MDFEAFWIGQIKDVVPRPRRDLHDSAPQRSRQSHARKERPPVVEDADDIAIADATLLGIERIHSHWLAAMDLRLLTGHTVAGLCNRVPGRFDMR